MLKRVPAVQIVMTANTVVLCYVAAPRTPQEHLAASMVRPSHDLLVSYVLPAVKGAFDAFVSNQARDPGGCSTTQTYLSHSCAVIDSTRS